MVSEATNKVREPIAFGLLGVAALYLVSGLSVLFKSRDDLGGLDFSGRAALVSHAFADPILVLSLVGAVLLVVAGGYVSVNARTVVVIALVLGAVSLLFALTSWLVGLTDERISAYGGIDGAGRIVGVFLGLAQVGFLGLALVYIVAVQQAFPKPVRAQHAWGASQPGWGQPPQQSWGQPPQQQQQSWEQPPQQSWGPQPQQQWGQPAQQQWGQPAHQSWAQPPQQPQQQSWGPPQPQQPQHQAWTQPSPQQSWGDAPGSAPPPGSGWGAHEAGVTQPPEWGQPSGQTVWGAPAESDPVDLGDDGQASELSDAGETSLWASSGEVPAESEVVAESDLVAESDALPETDSGLGSDARPQSDEASGSSGESGAHLGERDPDDPETQSERDQSGWWRPSSS